MALRIRAALRNLLHKRRVEARLDAEVRSYTDLLTDEKIAAGISPDALCISSLSHLPSFPLRESG